MSALAGSTLRSADGELTAWMEAYTRSLFMAAAGAQRIATAEPRPDRHGVDLLLVYPRGSIGVQLKSTYSKHFDQNGLLRFPVKPNWVANWHSTDIPPRLVLYVLGRDPSGWRRQRGLGEMHRVHAYWATLDKGVSAPSVTIDKSNRFTTATLASWGQDLDRGMGGPAMTNVTHHALRDFLLRNGWRQGSRGEYGSLWALGEGEPVGIPHSLNSSSPDWGITLERLGLSMGMPARAVEQAIANALIDEISFTVPTTGDEIPLGVGAALFQLAQKVVRASATSSQRPGPVIDSVPRGAQRLIEQVTVGHTRHGSYVVPVRYPLDRTLVHDAEGQEAAPQQPLEGAWSENWESVQRRASRTLMQALGVLDREVLQPDRLPTVEAVRSLVPAGVTRELVTAVRLMVVTDEVDQVRTVANWATTVRKPARTPDRVVVEREAAEVLKITAKQLGDMKPTQRGEVIAGPLVSLDTHGAGPERSEGIPATVGVQVVRRGRQSTIYVETEPGLWRDVNHWLESGEMVMAFGVIQRGPKGLELAGEGCLSAVGQGTLPGV